MRFVAVFADDAPLVVALDDLQWIDRASLELLGALLGEGEERAILFVGTYRRDLVDAGHPLVELRERLAAQRRAPTSIELRPLSRAALEQLLAQVLRRPLAEVAELAPIITNKTGNNPLAVGQFLLHLGDLGLLRRDRGGWRWDREAIAAAQIPEDILGILRVRLGRLAPQVRELLARAACVGERFDTAMLEQVAGATPEAVAASLYELEQAGLIAATASGFVIAHPRLRDAARELLAPDERRAVHRAVAEELLRRRRDAGEGRAEDTATVREFSDEIGHECERVATIVRNLLAFSRHESSETHCRPQQIQQILMNLVTNARDALNERYPGYHERKHIRLLAARAAGGPGAWVRLSVIDGGAGLPRSPLTALCIHATSPTAC